MITQSQYMVLKQPTRHLRVKIDIINEQNNIINSLQGISTSGDVNINSTSTYRRSGSVSVLIDKKHNLIPSPSSNIWFNKRVGISIGIEDYMGDTIWFNLGRFAILDCNLSFNSSELLMTLNLADLMAFLDGSLGGSLSHEIRMINKGFSVRQAVISVLQGLVPYSIERIEVDGLEMNLPYDIEKPSDSTAYEIVSELANLYMGYQFYFDVNGYFKLEKIRDKKDDLYAWDFTDINLALSYNNKINFTNVKNDIWVYGRANEYGYQVAHNYCNRFARNSIDEMNSIVSKNNNDICYVRGLDKSYIWTGSSWQVLSFNVLAMFNVENIGRKVRVVNMDTIFNMEQARLRGQYELEMSSNFAENISFSTVPIYALDANTKIRVVKDDIGVNGDYLIESVSIPLGIDSSMNVTATKIYYNN